MENKKYYEDTCKIGNLRGFENDKYVNKIGLMLDIENNADAMRQLLDISDKTKKVNVIIFNKERDGMGDISDGHHTFNELYHHRALLFAAYCNLIKDKDSVKCWKSKLHHT